MSGFTVTFPGNKKIDVAFNQFTIKTDQSKESGGDETAPEPFDVFISSLGACAGIYAKSFCDVRKLSTDRMYLRVDVVFRETKKLMEQVNLTLYVGQAFPEKYIRPIIKTMNACAVKNQLHPDINVRTAVMYMDH